MLKLAMALWLVVSSGLAQTAPGALPDMWKPLSFLLGTWDAKANGDGGATSLGTYTFRTELDGHILARRGSPAGGCKGPATFDCDHGDLLYVFQEMPGQPLKAIYLDNEGHVIHYDVSTPTPTSVMFLSDGSQPGPRYRLLYELAGTTMSGKFQMQLPGQTDWKSYLEWSGGKR